MSRARFLIVGASGFIGRRLLSVVGSANAVATYNRTPVPGGVHFDPAVTRLSDDILPAAPNLTHAFLLHAMSNIDECARQPELAYSVNVASMQRMIDDLVQADVTPVFASSDAVLDGTHGSSTEQDAVNPVLTYGRHKALIEQYLARQSGPWLVARLAKVVAGEPDAPNLLSDWMTQMENGATIRCARDQVFSPVDINDVTRILKDLAEKNLGGLYNICGPHSLTRLELLQMLADEVRKYRAVPLHIVACSIRDFTFAEPRPLDASMSPRKLYDALRTRCEDMSAVCARAAALRYGGPVA